MSNQTTKLADLVNPQVMADMISAKLPTAIRFSPLADLDKTLVGVPGSKITVPRYKYIGDADTIAEGIAMETVKLQSDTSTVEVKKAGKAVEITDEAVLSGLGDPIGETEAQILKAIASKVDADCLAALLTTELVYDEGTAWDLDTLNGAIDLFNDEDDEPMVLILNPKDATKLRKAAAGNWDRASDLGDQIIISGTYGGLLGAQVVRSKRVEEGTGVLVKEGALKIYLKRDVEIEPGRDILAKTTIITGDQHYVAYLYDESRAVKIEIAEGTDGTNNNDGAD